MSVAELKTDATLRVEEVGETLSRAMSEDFVDVIIIGIRRDRAFKVIMSPSPDVLRKLGALQFAMKDLMDSVK